MCVGCDSGDWFGDVRVMVDGAVTDAEPDVYAGSAEDCP